MTYWVYVIRILKTGDYHKGQTNNLERRLHEHELKKGKFEIILKRECATRSEAVKLERFFKTGKGREIITSLGGPIV
jgi:putative endonuclease